MRIFRTLSSRLFRAAGSDELMREIDEELRFHIEMRARDLVASGMTPERAHAAAAQRFGDVERIGEMCRAAHRGSVNWELVWPFAWMLAGLALAFWTMGREYHNMSSMFLITASIAIMMRSLVVARRLRRTKAFARASAASGAGESPLRIFEAGELQNICAHDALGRTPLQRVLEDE